MIAWRITAWLDTADDVTADDLRVMIEGSDLARSAAGGLQIRVERVVTS